MIRHIVLMKLKDVPEAERNGQLIKEGLERLVPLVPGMLATHVWLGFSANYNVCVTSDFESRQAFAAYGPHPEHQRMREFIHKVVENSRPAFDCEL